MFVPHDMILQPTSSEADPIWVANPKIRSTFDLVSSCILTLILCVWTAIHLNVPGYQEREAKGMLKWWKPIQKRILWMCVGLVAPEVVLYIAWQQYLQARFICEGMSKIEEIKPESSAASINKRFKNAETATESVVATNNAHQNTPPVDEEKGVTESQASKSLWQRFKQFINPPGLEKGYFIAMGGVEFANDKSSTVTPKGAIFFARRGLLQGISIDTIKDKSKADTLTKLLVCIQGSWMLVQAVGRKIEGLPITLLELNTIMHVVCALLMYLLWLKKPQDVRVPLQIADGTLSKQFEAMPPIRDIRLFTDYLLMDTLLYKGGKFHFYKDSYPYRKSYFKADLLALVPDECPRDFERVWDLEDNTERKVHASILCVIIPGDNPTIAEIRFWHHPSSPLQLQDAELLVSYISEQITTFKCKPTDADPEQVLSGYASNGLNLHGSIQSDSFTRYAAIIHWTAALILPAIYGGIHLTPWNSHFPTHLERYLWRFSGLFIACGVPTIIILKQRDLRRLCRDVLHPHHGVWEMILDIAQNPKRFITSSNIGELFSHRQRRRRIPFPRLMVRVIYNVLIFLSLIIFVILFLVITIICVILAALYPLSRSYILIEAFASLRSLPVDSYKTVEWAEMWPHF